MAQDKGTSAGEAQAVAEAEEGAYDDGVNGRAVGRPQRVACQMVQHYPYFPPMHGYYYFRPYTATQVPLQQQFIVTHVRGDQRNPYANEVFRRVFAEYKADHPASATPKKDSSQSGK